MQLLAFNVLFCFNLEIFTRLRHLVFKQCSAREEKITLPKNLTDCISVSFVTGAIETISKPT